MKEFWLLEKRDLIGSFYVKGVDKPTTDHNQAIKFESEQLAKDWKDDQDSEWLTQYSPVKHSFAVN